MNDILKNATLEFGNYLISVSNNDEKKKLIETTIINLEFYKILLFITFFDKNKLDNEIIKLITDLEIDNTEEIFENIKTHLTYFIKVGNIINNRE